MDDSYFRPFLNPLGTTTHLVTYTQGRGAARTADGLVAEFLDTCARLASPHGLFILAHSFGAALVFAALQEAVQHIDGLILVNWLTDANWIDEFEVQHPGFMAKATKRAEAKGLDTVATMRADVEQYAEFYFADTHIDVGRDLLRSVQYDPQLSTAVFDSLLNRARGFASLKERNIPTCSIMGLCDRVVTPGYIRHRESELAVAERHELMGAGHFPFVERGDVFCAIVMSFLRQLSKSGAPTVNVARS